MLKRIKKILKNKRGAVTTVEILGWVAVVSIVLVAVVMAMKPAIIGNDSILTNSVNRIEDLDNVMNP